MATRPERPTDADYYERDRVERFSQGDVFRDVPLAYPSPADELLIADELAGASRRFLSGPLTFGPAMLPGALHGDALHRHSREQRSWQAAASIRTYVLLAR